MTEGHADIHTSTLYLDPEDTLSLKTRITTSSKFSTRFHRTLVKTGLIEVAPTVRY